MTGGARDGGGGGGGGAGERFPKLARQTCVNNPINAKFLKRTSICLPLCSCFADL